jgi:hypothetical protein
MYILPYIFLNSTGHWTYAHIVFKEIPCMFKKNKATQRGRTGN